MARWRPGSADRMRQAAAELFERQGFDETTAAQIAEAAGVGERTFFRHFADKRDVLFAGQDVFVGLFLDGVASAPEDSEPMEMVAEALRSAATFFPDERRAGSRIRASIIGAHAALQERERHKMSSLAAEIGAALRTRGVAEPAATLAAESGTTVFGVAYEQWLAEGETRSMEQISVDMLAALRDLRG